MKPVRYILAERDLDFDPGAYVPATCDALLATLGLPDAHRELLRAHNGLYAFDGALHMYGCTPGRAHHDLESRNRPAPWRAAYGPTVERLVMFAEEVFGNQYAYGPDGVVFLDLESGDVTVVAADFEEWMAYVVEETDFATGRPFARAWAEEHGPRGYDTHLCPRMPFIAGGEYELGNLFAIPWGESLALRSDIAEQIRHLPEGTPITLRLVD